MNELLNQPKPKPEQKDEKPKLAGMVETDYLKEIAAHLKSIRSMLQFFTVLVILAVLVQACAVLGLV